MKIATSILEFYNKETALEQITKLDQTTCDFLHLDIMDGIFVPSCTWTEEQIAPLISACQKPLDIHFMVEDVKQYVLKFLPFKPSIVTFHIEAVPQPQELIQLLHEHNISVGLSIKPDTPVSVLLPYLDQIDWVLIMSVEPGKGGQSFLKSSIDKVEQLKKLRKEHGFIYQIEMDGGINDLTIRDCLGADMVVVGSYITKAVDFESQIINLREKI